VLSARKPLTLDPYNTTVGDLGRSETIPPKEGHLGRWRTVGNRQTARTDHTRSRRAAVLSQPCDVRIGMAVNPNQARSGPEARKALPARVERPITGGQDIR
jgi:hypothetical protein